LKHLVFWDHHRLPFSAPMDFGPAAAFAFVLAYADFTARIEPI
jgi:hypothetical protein